MTPTSQSTQSAQANMIHDAYKIAHHDHDFLGHEDMRGVRLMLEYQKAESAIKAMHIETTVVVFGSARVLSPEQSEMALMDAKTSEEKTLAVLRAKQVPWYEMSRDFGKIVSLHGGALKSEPGAALQNVIATGGGPGLMEAANRGAHDVGALSIGYNITLKHEQQPNPYSTPELTFLFKFFGIRKMHMAMRMSSPGALMSGGLAVMPGGAGTFDELFDNNNMTIH